MFNPANPNLPTSTPDTAAYLWLDVPLAWTDLRGCLRGANAAFAEVTGIDPAPAAGQTLAALLGCPHDATASLAAGHGVHRCRVDTRRGPMAMAARVAGALQLVSLQPPGDGTERMARLEADRDRLTAERDQLAERLGLAQRLGNFGLWERDLRTLDGVWDASMWRFFSGQPQSGSMSFPQAQQNMHPDDRELVRQALLSSADVPGNHRVRYRVRGNGQDWRHVHSRWEVGASPGGRAPRALGIVIDETDSIRLAQSFDHANAQLRLAVELAGLVVWHYDSASHCFSLNEHGWTLLGLAPMPRGLPLATLAAMSHPDDTGLLHMGPTDDDAPRDLPLRFRPAASPLGSDWRWLLTRRVPRRNEQGRLLGFVGVALDLTERQRAEQQLRDASERSALAARGAGIGTWESAPDGQVGWWDEQMFRLRGLEPRSGPVRREDMLLWVHPEDRLATQESLGRLSESTGVTNREFRVVWPDGSVHWLASRSSVVADDRGRTLNRIGINWDITEARQAAVARQEKLLAQRESQAKSRFLARMSHELRTPMNAILGFTQLLMTEGASADPEVSRRRVQRMHEAGLHLLALIDDVLELSSLETGDRPPHLQPLALEAQAATALAPLADTARARQVSLSASGLAGVRVVADEARLRQVLAQLLSNAVKFNRVGGAVRLSAEPAGERVRIVVEDTGLGMDAAQLAHLFEPFNRLGRDHDGIGGTGIGLAIVHAAVQQMGGSVEAASTPGVGSRFTLLLPAADPRAGPPAVVAADTTAHRQVALPTVPPAGAPVGTVLYIEDNEVNQLIVREMLHRRPGVTCLAATNGLDGLALARQHRPHLILLDMQLPDIDGHEVLARLRNDPLTADIRCIAVSANAMPEDIQRALAAGCAAYWTKPLDLRAFLSSLDELFEPN